MFVWDGNRLREERESEFTRARVVVGISRVPQKMPHRTTYFFPRQFPDRGFDATSSTKQDHEKKIAKETAEITTENDIKSSSTKKDLAPAKQSFFSDYLTGEKLYGTTKKQQIAALSSWLAGKKGDRSSTHAKSSRRSSIDEDRELLLPPESAPPDRKSVV